MPFKCQKEADNLEHLIDIHFVKFFILGILSFHNQLLPMIKAREFEIYILKQESKTLNDINQLYLNKTSDQSIS